MTYSFQFTSYSAYAIHDYIKQLQRTAEHNGTDAWIEFYGAYPHTSGESNNIEAVLVSGHRHRELVLSEIAQFQNYPQTKNEDNNYVGTFKLQLVPVTESVSLLVLQSTKSIRRIAPKIDIALINGGHKSIYIGRHDKDYMLSQLRKNTRDLSNDPVQFEKNIETLYDIIITEQEKQSKTWFESIAEIENAMNQKTIPRQFRIPEAYLGIHINIVDIEQNLPFDFVPLDVEPSSKKTPSITKQTVDSLSKLPKELQEYLLSYL